MHAEGTQHPLEAVLEQEVRCTESLLECLEAERLALIRRDLEALEKTIQDKVQHSQLLEQLERQRESIVSALGFDTDPRGLTRCYRSLPQAEQLIELWAQILTNIEVCRTSNITNGGILELGRQHVEQALSILRGQSGTPSLYDPHGATAANLGKRELGKV
jgi:flagellar biosynthesis/type III secretory pathway chaperone